MLRVCFYMIGRPEINKPTVNRQSTLFFITVAWNTVEAYVILHATVSRAKP